MFSPLPAETVFEARRRSRRRLWLLFGLLALTYILIFNLLAEVLASWLYFKGHGLTREQVTSWMGLATTAAVVAAAFHFLRARSMILFELLGRLGTRDADPLDEHHAQFIRLVQEAEAVSGLRGLRPVLLADAGRNAFCIQDSKGRSAIGVTEGLLGRLSRAELSAVVAHETAHLIHGDSQLITTACSLFTVFAGISKAMEAMSDGIIAGKRKVGAYLPLLALYLVSLLGYGLTRLICMAISRQREYLADADAVRLCKEPLALVGGLQKISQRPYCGVPQTYSTLFIAPPSPLLMGEINLLDELGPFFSDHPPLSKRVQRLMVWAKEDLKKAQGPASAPDAGPVNAGSTSAGPAATAAAAATPAAFLVHHDAAWQGPFSAPQLLALGWLTPETWVCPAGSQAVAPASESGDLLPLFKGALQGAVSAHACPRCKVPLLKRSYEGAELEECSFCKGRLLKPGVLERILAREFEAFTPAQILKANTWRDRQHGPLKARSELPRIDCPVCKEPMAVRIHTLLTQVVLDRCLDEHCGALWCDGGELETMQMLMEAGRTASTR